MTARKAVFLDRDGVLNEPRVIDGKPYPPRRLEDLKIETTARAACVALKGAGFKLICVTNQPDVARGQMEASELIAINDAVAAALDLDEVVACPHSDEDRCACRKPKPGMIRAAAARHAVEIAESFMVGDRWRDIEAGRAAGAHTIFIDRRYAERRPTDMDFVCADLGEAAHYILTRQRRN